MNLKISLTLIVATVSFCDLGAATLFTQSGSQTETLGNDGTTLVDTTTDIGDWITAGGYDTGSGTAPLYFTATINVTNNLGENGGGGFFHGVQLYKGGERFAIGNNWFSVNWGGFKGPGDFDLTGSTPITLNNPVNLVYKVDQASDAITIWLNPDLGLTEAGQAAGSVTALTGLGTNDEFEAVNVRGNGSTTFSGITIGTDSPFAAVPEPGSALLTALGGLVLLRRKR
ncbi:MAG: PEP-CTERM sorting domain-containing protein [Verrucomicrobiaceae bacterium]